jgi:hypothetical protein
MLMKTRFLTTFLFIFLFHTFSASQAFAKAKAGPDQTVDEGDTVILDGSESKLKGGNDIYQWQQVKKGPRVVLQKADEAIASFTAPQISKDVTLTFKLTVRSTSGKKETDETKVHVLDIESNDPPTADAGPDQTVLEKSTVTLDGSNSSDPDDDIESYRWKQTAGPSVSLSDPRAVQPTFTSPSVVDRKSKSLKFELTVTDVGGLKDTDTIVVNVTEENDPPTADAGPDQNVDEETTVRLDGSNSSDPDDDIESYRWKQTAGPSVSLSNPTDEQPTFTSPSVEASKSKSLKFELTVTDYGGLKDTDTIVVNVTGENDPPTADAGPDQNVDEETTVRLDGSNSSDPDDGIEFYRWKQTAGPSVSLSNPTDDQPTFSAPTVGSNGDSFTFELTVTDYGSLQSTNTTIVNVIWLNDPPAANAGDDQTVLEKSAVTLNGSNSSDPDDGIASYQWKQVAGQSVTFSDPTDDQPTFVAPSFDDSGDQPLIFELIVTDDGGLQSSDSTNVSVSNFEKDNPGASGGGCFIDTAAYGFLVAQ